jgi:hypothetical protein
MSANIDGPQDAPDVIVPQQPKRRGFGERVTSLKEKVTTRHGLLGDYNYGELYDGVHCRHI